MGLEEAMRPREALLLVVKVVQVVFHVSTSNHSIFEKNQKTDEGNLGRHTLVYRY